MLFVFHQIKPYQPITEGKSSIHLFFNLLLEKTLYLVYMGYKVLYLHKIWTLDPVHKITKVEFDKLHNQKWRKASGNCQLLFR